MLEKYKSDADEKVELQINQKTANVANQFRKVNQAQKNLEERNRRQAESQERYSDKK